LQNLAKRLPGIFIVPHEEAFFMENSNINPQQRSHSWAEEIKTENPKGTTEN
jgi:hypothetical protein